MTVATCTHKKDVQFNGKTVPTYTVVLADGTTGESFGKEIPVGTPAEQIEITEGQYGKKFKWNKPGAAGGFNKAAKGNESFALSYAKDLVVGGKVDIKQILETADKLYNWLESKKK